MMKNDMSKFVSMGKDVATCMVHHPLPADLSAVTTLYLQKKVRLAMRKTAICVMALLAGSACMAPAFGRGTGGGVASPLGRHKFRRLGARGREDARR